jgi:hypothetical protein
MTNAGAVAAANLQREMWDREAAVISGDCIRSAFHPAQQLFVGELYRFASQSDVNGRACDFQGCGISLSFLGASRREQNE